MVEDGFLRLEGGRRYALWGGVKEGVGSCSRLRGSQRDGDWGTYDQVQDGDSFGHGSGDPVQSGKLTDPESGYV